MGFSDELRAATWPAHQQAESTAYLDALMRGEVDRLGYAEMVAGMEPVPGAMRAAALEGFATATDLADYLVRKGLPFRDCHEIVGHAVKYGVASGKDLAEMSLDELRQFSDQIGDDVFAVLTLEGSVNARDHIGGTAPNQVRAAVARGQALLAAR